MWVVIEPLALWRRLGLDPALVAQLEAADAQACAALSGDVHADEALMLARQAAPVLRNPRLMRLLDGYRAVLNELATTGLLPR